jgi:hypothetical protein
VIRLVTQFDDAEKRAAVATPTCGGCCCCCCCIASIVSTSAFTSMHLRARARILKEATGRSPSPGPEILGLLALPAAGGAGGVFASTLSGTSLFVAFAVVWFLMLLLLYRWVGVKNPWLPAFGTVVIGSVVFGIELVVAVVLLNNLGAYLFLAVVAAIVAILVEYQLLLARR